MVDVEWRRWCNREHSVQILVQMFNMFNINLQFYLSTGNLDVGLQR